MPFQRIFKASYPCVYETWKTDEASWVIQDLAPEDDDAALEILRHNMINDEVLCGIQKLYDDPASVEGMMEYWKGCLEKRTSLGCYEEKKGQKTLVALNVCIVGNIGDHDESEIKGEKWKHVYNALKYAESKADAYEIMGLETILHAMGLVVKKEYRGKRLGQKLLAAREPLCLSQGIKGTATVFTGIGSQKPAANCGFHTIAEVSIRDLAEAGLPYPRDDDRVIKYMVKKYV